MAISWEIGRVKAQLRLTSQRLGQLQDRMDSQAQITQRDTSILLQQGNIAMARAKAQRLIREDIQSDLLQTLEMHVGVILGHLGELERASGHPSPIVAEAASSIIFAGLCIELKELHQVREILMHTLGPDFTRSALNNQDNCVSLRVLRALGAPPPTAARLDQYLYGIARTNNVNWLPDLSPQDKVNALAPIVDPEIVSVVDLANLRSLCSHGLPSHPPWLRPRVWRLLLGTLPVDKTIWRKEAHTQRDNYYDLIRRLLEPLASLPDPSEPLSPTDQSILDVFHEFSMVPPSLLATLEEEPEACSQCPLDATAPEDIKIACTSNLDDRLRLIREKETEDLEDQEPSSSDTPKVQLAPEIRLDETPEVDIEMMGKKDSRSEVTANGLDALSPSSTHSGVSTTLLPSRAYTSFGAHNKHSSALLRLLYIHACLNPANRSPQIGSLLVPIYATLVEEVDPEDVPHVEADTFWIFEALVGEFSELEDEQNGTVWVKKLSERLRWADADLADDLTVKGLDPGLPHYSFRWLIPLLTHTLPLPAVLMVWDALFSQPMRERDENPKLEYLIDLCTSMLVSARGTLLQLGRMHRRAHHLWGDEIGSIPSNAFGERELEEAFVEGMAFLQKYPLEAVGGIEKVLQTAADLATQRKAAANAAKSNGSASGLGARLRETVWKGFSSNLESHPEEDSEEEASDDDSDDAPHQQQPGSTLTSRWANTVWRGITNQSAVEESPPASSPAHSPMNSPRTSPLSTSQSAPVVPARETVTNAAARGRSMILGYAEKLKDSDAAATLSKVSTNWRVKALDAWNKRGNEPTSNTLSPPPSSSLSAPSLASGQDHGRSISLTAIQTSPRFLDGKRGSLPIIDRSDAYSPPPMPAFFRPVRDSVMVASPISRSGATSPVSDSGSTSSMRQSISYNSKTPQSRGSAGGPRPLLLNSSALMTANAGGRSPVSPLTESKWADSVRAKRPPDHRASQSSVSSLGHARADNRSDFESDGGGSRIVPIHRNKSPSPMATVSRRGGTVRASFSPPPPPAHAHRRFTTEPIPLPESGPGQVDVPDSPMTVPSPPPPGTPDADTSSISEVRVTQPESQRQRGSVVLTERNEDVPVAHPSVEGGKLSRRTATLSRVHRETEHNNNSDTSATEPPSSPSKPYLRRKRPPPRLQSLRHSKNGSATEPPVPPMPSRSLDVPAVAEREEAEFGAATPTPRASRSSFDGEYMPPSSPRARRSRKASGESDVAVTPGRTRKVSGEGRTRKISTESRRKVSTEREVKHKRESAAVEGDDEGYNDLLSAYESEDVY